METKTLRVVARGTAMVPDFERMEAGTRAFIGRKYIETKPGTFGFDPIGMPVEVPNRAEYIKALIDGDLWPADKATADACGLRYDAEQKKTVPNVIFDATYGGKVSAPTPIASETTDTDENQSAPKNALQQLAPPPATSSSSSTKED